MTKEAAKQDEPGAVMTRLSRQQEAGSASVLTLDVATLTIELPPDLPTACLPPAPPGSLSAKQENWVRSKHNTSNRFEQDAPPLERTYHLSQEFVMMLAERREADLDPWLTEAERSGLPEFKKMAHGIRQDYAAVKAAFSSEWSNGQVEAQVNCLKRKPRLMFGRAKFDLLRQRVLSRV